MSEENKRVVRRYFEELDRRKGTPVDLCADRFRFDVAGLVSARQHANEHQAHDDLHENLSLVACTA
jgi:hypothetical protein